MKKFNLSLVTVLAMSTFAIAGGDIAPVEPEVMVETPMVVEDRGLYVGIAYGWQQLALDDRETGDNYLDKNFGSIMLDVGYKFNPYIAVEGRYWFGIDADTTLGWTHDIRSNVQVDSWGLYAKPMYPVSDAFDIYALLGYGSSDVTIDHIGGGSSTSDSIDAFSWGIGVEYAFAENTSVFLDFTRVLSEGDTDFEERLESIGVDTDVDTINLGINYRF